MNIYTVVDRDGALLQSTKNSNIICYNLSALLQCPFRIHDISVIKHTVEVDPTKIKLLFLSPFIFRTMFFFRTNGHQKIS